MRWTLVCAALCAAQPLAAQSGVVVESSIFVEDGQRLSQLEPSAELMRGDRVITVMRWKAPARGSYTVTNPIPRRLALESASRGNFEVSTDGGTNWQLVSNPERMPQGVTHMRWRTGAGEGRLTYRAVVR
ncbi:hypothetical protein GRI97_12420 [Altererythrobacter xixiisoli]|uniref:Uncharacterized protein n=1 Tax=Croceibacterium xixiisoli TaxID=1476466 RepID=A0A6I4TZK9_9SPHN|nr:hypothetical protein [Croceibacterium xixiisoli]MXO99793.1 hypothetical protein [Croceibacterium xixiisoli]